MTGRKQHYLQSRLAIGFVALLALGGAMGAGHAQTQEQAPQTIASVAISSDLARFTPSQDAEFDDAFAHLDGVTADPVLPAHAVDLDTIEPPLDNEARRLGSGVASYYGRRFAGRPTASGERFDPQRLTAAHRTLPFGSRVRVTNPRNGQSVIVRINDRGPFVAGRMIDLSRGAAEQIGMISSGHATVDLELLNS